MSKRYIYPQQYGQRKKARLDISISDHNFPLSQNAGPSKEVDNWGDENDDEILLLASQACEEAYGNNDLGDLPDYSMCMNPARTSTQIPHGPGPSSSHNTFKKPSATSTAFSSNNLKDNCNRISSPLPGIANKISTKGNLELIPNDNLYSDKIYKSHDTDYIYKQLLQLQEDNAKLKSENGKLLEKCVTKDGEVSILRTQLKTCQVSVDNARLDKIKAQEKVQMEWTDKLTAANKEMQELRTKLDFKNLEIISMKERCCLLESSKVKLTQVTVAAGDISSSQRKSINEHTEPSRLQRRVAVASSSAQTNDNKPFIKLNKACRSVPSKLKHYLPHMLQPTTDKQLPILEHNDKLFKPPDFSQDKCRIYSAFHRMPSAPMDKDKCISKLAICDVYEDLTAVVTLLNMGMSEELVEKYRNLVSATTVALVGVQRRLEVMSSRSTPAFQRDMDERYLEATKQLCCPSTVEMLGGDCLFKDEQEILSRRLITILSCIIQEYKHEIFVKHIVEDKYTIESDERLNTLDVILRICGLLDSISCAVPYSGLVSSIVQLCRSILRRKSTELSLEKCFKIVKCIISSRPMPAVMCDVLSLLRTFPISEQIVMKLCTKSSTGNLKVDYDQGVVLYKKESCQLQVLLKQAECCLKCAERHHQYHVAASVAGDLLHFHTCFADGTDGENVARCECRKSWCQVLVQALQLCALFLKKRRKHLSSSTIRSLQSSCRSGVVVLYRLSSLDAELGPAAAAAGLHDSFLQLCLDMSDDIVLGDTCGTILSELSMSLQPSSDDAEPPDAAHRQVWLDTFTRFTITD